MRRRGGDAEETSPAETYIFGAFCSCASADLQVNATQVGRKRYHVTLRTQLFSTQYL